MVMSSYAIEITNFWGNLKTNEKSFKNRNELLLACYSETNEFNQKQFG